MSKKKKIIISTILLILVVVVVIMTISYRKYIFNNQVKEVECKNNISSIDIGKIKTFELDNQQYIMIEVSNNTTDNKYDLSIEIQFVNENNDVIFTTGTVKEVLLVEMNDNVCAKINNEVSDLVQSNMIDHIIINEL